MVSTRKYVLFDSLAAWGVTLVLALLLFLFVSQQPPPAPGTTPDVGEYQSSYESGRAMGRNVLFPAVMGLIGGGVTEWVVGKSGAE